MIGMDLSTCEDSEISNGIILGCWDHENTFLLIKELEDTVNTAEKKCAALMQELMNYKKYYEEWSSRRNNFMIVSLKKKKKRSSKNGKISNSISDNSIARKPLIDGDKIFYEKLKSKISEVNDEITYANMKIGFKNNILLPAKEYKENLRASTALCDNNDNLTPAISLDSEKFEDFCSNSFKLTKSDPILGDKDKNKLCKDCEVTRVCKEIMNYKVDPVVKKLEMEKISEVIGIVINNQKEQFIYKNDAISDPLYKKLSSTYAIGRDNQSPKGESRRKMRSESLQHAKKNSRDKIELTVSEPFFMNQRKNLSRDKTTKINKAPSENDMPLALLSTASKTLDIGENIEECISLIKEKNIRANIDATLNVTVSKKCMKAISDLLISDSTNVTKNFSKISSSADNCNNLTKAVNLIFGNKNHPEAARKQRFKHTNGGSILEDKNNFAKRKGAGEGDDGRNFKEELTAELSAIHDDFLNLHKKYSSLRKQISKNAGNFSMLNLGGKFSADYGNLINF